MSDSDSFIREVTEEVDRDRMNRQLKKWGPWIGVGLLVLVGLAAAWNWQKDQDRLAAEEIGRILLSEELTDPARAQDARDALTGPPSVLADFRLAEAQITADDREGAVETYERIAARSDVSRAYTDLAALRGLRLRAASAPDEAQVALAPLTAPDRPYRLLAQELRATLMLNSGDVAGAHALLRAILADPARTVNLSDRVSALLLSSGGDFEQ